MSDIAVLYDINVWLEEHDEHYDRHSVVYLEAHDNAWQSSASNAAKLHAAKWRVGVISRVQLRLLRELLDQNVAVEHGCTSRYGRDRELGDYCGCLYAHRLIDQAGALAAGGDSACVGVVVPFKEGKKWADRARHLVSRVITTDAAPPPPDEHEQVVITESTQTRKANT